MIKLMFGLSVCEAACIPSRRGAARTVGHGDLLLGPSPGGDGVGPEALQRPVLRSLLLGFRCLRGAGIQHGLEDPSARVDEPGHTQHFLVLCLQLSQSDQAVSRDLSAVHPRETCRELEQRTHQLLTCRSVRFVCVAICFFSSSVGYGCCRHTNTLSDSSSCLLTHQLTRAHTHPDVLEKPRAHDVGGVFGQDAAFVLRRGVVMIEKIQVLMKLQLELRRDNPCYITHTNTPSFFKHCFTVSSPLLISGFDVGLMIKHESSNSY